jgi:hypothetical protein
MGKNMDEGTGASGPGSGVGFRRNTAGTTKTTVKKKNDEGSGKPGNKTQPRKFVTVAPIFVSSPAGRGRVRREMLPDIQTYTDE